jgi:hypothetical protein
MRLPASGVGDQDSDGPSHRLGFRRALESAREIVNPALRRRLGIDAILEGPGATGGHG